MVPVVGAVTDRSTSRWGRRRPFMVWGSLIVSAGLLLLGWTEEIVGFFVREGMLV
jgi:solute carrier family 45, member 1/2/4